jgi:hypothetical protein
MQLSDLDPDCLAAIKTVRWDRIIEKHEGPEDWEAVLRWYDPEFMMIEGRPVLLPVGRSHHVNITILRTIWSADGNSLTLFLRDTTYGDDWFMSGFMAVCDRMVGQDFYLAILYHEWFIIESPAALEAKWHDDA